MLNTSPTIIPISRLKLLVFILVCMAFVALGTWLMFYSPQVENSFIDSSLLKYSAGGFATLVFGAFLVFLVTKLFDPRPGIIIDKDGLTDNSSAIAVGHIPWHEISGIKSTRMWSEKFITIFLKDPQKYIDRQKNSIKKRTLISNCRRNGSPVNISTNALKTNHTSLARLLEDRLHQFREA